MIQEDPADVAGVPVNNVDQDRFLPIANIGRIMKQALPEGKEAKIAKDARETVQECVSDFISFITSEACEKCQLDKRRTINGNDLIYAMKQLGFDRYVENLELYYTKYKEFSDVQAKENVNNIQAAKQQQQANPAAQGGDE